MLSWQAQLPLLGLGGPGFERAGLGCSGHICDWLKRHCSPCQTVLVLVRALGCRVSQAASWKLLLCSRTLPGLCEFWFVSHRAGLGLMVAQAIRSQ